MVYICLFVFFYLVVLSVYRAVLAYLLAAYEANRFVSSICADKMLNLG